MDSIKADIIEKQINNNLLELTNDSLKLIDPEIAEFIKNKYKGKLMFKLNPDEIHFFEWLKLNDLEVWNDLWEGAENPDYLVSIDFLPYLIKYKTGFPICDLINNDNYYFVPIHLKNKEMEFLSDSLKTRLRNKETLTPAQLLLIEISLHPIDIWHFAYKYNLLIKTAKDAVQQLVDDEAIVHFKDSEHLANFIDV